MNMSLFHQSLRFLLVLIWLLFIYFFAKYMLLFFFPFLLALLLSFIMHPVVTYIENSFRIKRIFATLIVVVSSFIVMSSLIVFILTEIIEGTTYLAVEMPRHLHVFTQFIDTLLVNKVIPLYQQFADFFSQLNQTQQSTINEQVQQIIAYITTSGTKALSQFLLKIPTALSLIPYLLTMLFFTIMATFFITNDWYALRMFSLRMMPNRLQAMCKNLLAHFNIAFIGFLKAQFILISISTCLTLIGLVILQINHAITISFLIAFVDLLPLLGTGIIFLPWIVYLFLTKNYSLTIGLTILYMIIIITRQILEPKILATNIGVHPLFALIIVFISLQLWGISGIIITPLLLILTNVVYRSGLVRQIWNFIKNPNHKH